MYTQLFLDVTLKQDAPVEIIDVLNDMVNNDCDFWKEKKRLNWCFNSSSYYFHNNNVAQFCYDKICKDYRLLVLCDFKNYGNEIETFIEWLMPYIYGDVGDYIGYHMYEKDKEPTHIFIKEVV